MPDPGTQIFVAVAGIVLGAAARPYIDRLLPKPGRVGEVERELRRLHIEQYAWEQEQRRSIAEEVQAKDAELAARGVVDSGLRHVEHDRIREKHVSAALERSNQNRRSSEELFETLTPLERWQLVRRIGPIEEQSRKLGEQQSGAIEKEIDSWMKPRADG
jgi:hypothetical protein